MVVFWRVSLSFHGKVSVVGLATSKSKMKQLFDMYVCSEIETDIQYNKVQLYRIKTNELGMFYKIELMESSELEQDSQDDPINI